MFHIEKQLEKDIVAAWLARSKLKPTQVAKLLGIPDSTPHRWFKGASYPTQYVSRLAKEVLHIPVEALCQHPDDYAREQGLARVLARHPGLEAALVSASDEHLRAAIAMLRSFQNSP